MKANEAPERIWINSPQDLPCGTVDSNSVEYTRTDAFIEKALKWLKHSLDNGCWVANDVGEQEKEAIIEHFKETMKLKE